MTMMTGVGWGGEEFGRAPWGGAYPAVPQLQSALAVSENVIQLFFTVPIYFSGLFDIEDASNKARYTITPVAGSIGLDGTPAKPLLVAAVDTGSLPGTYMGQVILLTTDRPMTPNPAQYIVKCNGLWSQDQTEQLLSTASSAQFNAVYKQVALPQTQTLTVRGDFANPQDLDAITSGITPNPTAVQLGSYVVDDTGDYAVETGLVGYKKRILRRIIATPGAFLHLGQGYGAGVRLYGKKLGSATKRAQLTAAVEAQVSLEPETAKVRCTSSLDPLNPGLIYLVVLARTKTGKVLKVIAPINVST
jgi:hypothetical protein